MSTTTNAAADSIHIQPLHNPSLAAQVVVPQAPVSNDSFANQALGMGAKALIARKLAKKVKHDPVSTSSPTDTLLTPCTQTLNDLRGLRRKHFEKTPKPIQLFPQGKENVLLRDNEDIFPQDKEDDESSGEGQVSELVSTENKMEVDDDENPF